MSLPTTRNVLLLTLVHPDFLPPVYTVAQVLRDEGFHVHILTFDSYTPAGIDLGKGITVESVGKHHGIGLRQRLSLRKKYRSRARILASEGQEAIIAFCAFTFLCGLEVKEKTSLVYHALEVADFLWGSIKRSPLSQFNNLMALKRIHRADLVATPSSQRSAWLAGRCGLQRMPETILNTAYLAPSSNDQLNDVYETLVPRTIRQHRVVLYTGAVNDRLCVRELVQAFCDLDDKNSSLIVTGIKDNEYCRSIQNIVGSFSGRERVLLLPYVTRQQMLALQEHAEVGACLMKSYDHDIESVMIAPNKVGEYLAKGLYLLACRSEYMMPMSMKGIAALANSPSVSDVKNALRDALDAVNKEDYKARVDAFVREFYCMQQQAIPIVDFIKKGSKNK